MTNTKSAFPQGRHLILIDIENLTASASPTPFEVAIMTAGLRARIPGYDDDQRIVACSHHAARDVAFAFPGARQLWRSGRDGADLALLEVVEREGVAQRYRRVTICSGDGIFAEASAWLAAVGVEVTVVSPVGRLSAGLRLAARHVVLLPSTAAFSVAGGGV